VQTTFPRLLIDHATARPAAPALREKEFGIWQTHSWSALLGLVEAIACGFAQAGLKRGQHVVVIGENRPRLYASMLAAQSLGAIPVPLYQDAPAGELVFPIANADVPFAVVEDQEQVDKLLEVRGRCPSLKRIWFDDPRGLRHYREPGLASLDALVAAGRAYARRARLLCEEIAKANPDDVAAVFFTSGTTGKPKGVVHSHDTLIDRARAGARFDKLTGKDEVLAYLAPAWIGQNIFSYAQWLVCGYVVNCPESASTVMLDLKEIGPTYYFAPPRVFEGLLTNVMIRMEDASPSSAGCSTAAWRTPAASARPRMDGKAPVDARSARLGARQLLIYSPLRNSLGFSRVRVAYTAGEADRPRPVHLLPLDRHQPEAALRVDRDRRLRLPAARPRGRADTVGVPIDGVEIKVDRVGRDPGPLAGPAEGVLQDRRDRRVLTPGRLVQDRRRRLPRRRRHLKIIDRAKDVGRIVGGANAARCSRPSTSRTSSSSSRTSRKRSPSATPRPRLRLRQHRHGGGRQLGREAQPQLRQLRRPGAEAAGARADPRMRREGQLPTSPATTSSPAARSAASSSCTRSSTPTTAS
jgi:long-chain acyl-CoA synthetase